jgi:hypothetical protein
MERNLSLSPSSMALLTMDASAFTASSMGTGGMFSPPAVMISSEEEPQRASEPSGGPLAPSPGGF